MSLGKPRVSPDSDTDIMAITTLTQCPAISRDAPPDARRAFNGPLAPLWAVGDRRALAVDLSNRRGMVRIADRNVDGVAFMFRTRQEAEARSRGGGSAFAVGRPLAGSKEIAGRTLYLAYLISCRHVVYSGSACVASVNRWDGGPPDIWEFEQEDWVAHPDGDDVAAVCAHGYFDSSTHKLSFIPEHQVITPQFITERNVGMGDEVFMIGRFYNHQGKKTNRPALRQGGLSMMLENIWVKEDRRTQESFAVEMRSKEGFSGSPVVVWRTPVTDLSWEGREPEDNHFWRLLGVNWGYIFDEAGENTFLNGVVPAWKISELLRTPTLQARHEAAERELAENASSVGRQTSADGEPRDLG